MRKFKNIICLLMVPVFLFICCSCGDEKVGNTAENTSEEKATEQVKYTTPAGLVKKTETVYVNLDNNGGVTQTIVSDWIHTDKAEVYVNDITSLSEIENIKDDSEPDIGANNSLRWYMNSTDLYYQGVTNKTLPVNFEIFYSMDGVPSVPSEIIGKSGKIEITIKMHNVDSYNVKINGRDMVMYNPLMVIGGVTLSETKFQNIIVKNGKASGNGNNQVAVLVGFPGINESLGLSSLSAENTESTYSFDDTFVISADVTDFEMGNIMFAAVPIASLGIGLNDISSSMDDVRNNLAKLQSIQQSLQSVDADGLLNTLTSNPDKIKELSRLAEDAAVIYDNNKALIDVLNKYATSENMATISELTKYISTADYAGLENALSVINSFFGGNADGAKLQEGINLLKELSADLKNPEVQTAINNLPQTISTISSLQTAVNENKDLINALKVLSESDALSSLDSALSGVEGSLAAGSLSGYASFTGSADELTAKMTGWIELGKKYTIFTKKVEGMDSNVMFVFKVDGLKTKTAKDVNAQKTEAEDTSGLNSVFKNIFG